MSKRDQVFHDMSSKENPKTVERHAAKTKNH